MKANQPDNNKLPETGKKLEIPRIQHLLSQKNPQGFLLSPLGIEIPLATKETDLKDLIRQLSAVAKFYQWAVGDVARFAMDQKYNGALIKLAKATQYSESRLRRLSATAKAFPSANRNSRLLFNHHEVLLDHEPSARGSDLSLWEKRAADWLEKAERRNWTPAELKAALSGAKPRERLVRDLGFAPKTKPGAALTRALYPILTKRFLDPGDLVFLNHAIEDMRAALAAVEKYVTTAGAEHETTTTEGRERALEAALQDYLANKTDTPEKAFSLAAGKHNLSVRDLGQYRLKVAVDSLDLNSKARVCREFRLKPDKLNQYLARLSTSRADRKKDKKPAKASPGACPKHKTATPGTTCIKCMKRAIEDAKAGRPVELAAAQYGVPMEALSALLESQTPVKPETVTDTTGKEAA